MTVHFHVQNYKRVAEVWMDEYAKYIYDRRPYYKQIDPGKDTFMFKSHFYILLNFFR